MIESNHVTKYFDEVRALDDITGTIREGSVFGLIGTNGAGKSTFMRTMAGVLKPDVGTVKLDGQDVFENPEVKSRIFYISDDQYYFANATPGEIRDFYAMVYPKTFSKERFNSLIKGFDLPLKRKVNNFSKGMKKQLSVVAAIAAGTDYIFCDETFDGLDPVMRQAVKSIFAEEVADRGLTPVIASHSLRELEDICDHVGLLHRGGILLSQDLDDLKLGLNKIQCAFADGRGIERFDGKFQIVQSDMRGSLITMTVRGDIEEIMSAIRAEGPVFAESLPLSLEEVFIAETGVVGYDFKKILF